MSLRLLLRPKMTEPFLKWPGGKRWLVQQHPSLFPSRYERYVEPFLGGGSVFFHLAPPNAVLADTNQDLINAYQCLKDDAKSIERRLAKLQREHGRDLYFRIRATRPTSSLGRAVRFLYLNRTCFNGIYRVNLKGDFNVPMGSKTLVEYPADYLQTIGAHLRNASLCVADFEKTIDNVKAGDFVFVDPPYTVMHNNNNFVKYNSSLFSWEDQQRLAGAIKRASSRGVAVMLSNADHHSVRALYKDFGHHIRVKRSSILAANPMHRRETTELIVTNVCSSW